MTKRTAGDPLLHEATRLADRLHDVDPPEVRVLRALVERVQKAEAFVEAQDAFATRVVSERDEARGKLHKVREAASQYGDGGRNDLMRALDDVLAILEDKTGN